MDPEKASSVDSKMGSLPTGLPQPDLSSEDEASAYSRNTNRDGRAEKRNALHPYVRPLTLADVESCHNLEALAFPPNERSTKEKFTYRLTKCGELSLGLFSTAVKDPALTNAATAAHAAFPDSTDSKAKEVLLAHVIATKCLTKVITDDAMGFPSDWQSEKPNPTNLGHHEAGRTVGVHSLAVLPRYQRIGLGTVILQSYLQRIGSSEIADSVALIAHDYLVPYYETFGFQSLGKSEAQFGGGGWYDMVFQIPKTTKIQSRPEEWQRSI